LGGTHVYFDDEIAKLMSKKVRKKARYAKHGKKATTPCQGYKVHPAKKTGPDYKD